MRNRVAPALALVLGASLALAGCSSEGEGLSDQWQQSGDKNYVAGDGSTTSFVAEDRGGPVSFAGVTEHGVRDGHYLYEVDGLGGRLFMDDANMPSLLSLPLTSDVAGDDPLYLETRRRVLSPENPFYYRGTAARGIGSPHTPPHYVWHIGLAVQGLTGETDEAHACLETILATDGGTGWTHEGFHVDDPARFTRPWFSWSNSMACELMMSLAESGHDAHA